MPDAAAERLKVFISYSRDDIEFADQLADALDVAGFATDLDRHGISGGEEWRPRLSEMIARVDTVVFALSPRSAGSPVCQWEVEESQRLGKRLLPVVIKPLGEAVVPQQLADLNYIHFYTEPSVPGSGFGGGLKRLASALKLDIAWVREATRYGGLAQSWEAGGRPQSRLLSGADIGLAKTWLEKKPRDVPEPPELVRELVRASEAAEQARSDAEMARVRALHDAELATAKAREEAAAAAAAKSKAEAEAARRLQLRTTVGLVAALLFALAAGGASWWAIEKQAEAVALQEAAEREQKRAENEARAALEAVRVVNILEGQFAGEWERGLTPEQREQKVFDRMRVEAGKGNVAAMRSIGLLHVRGHGTPQDFAAGHQWWERAVATGDARAMTLLGAAYEYGDGVPRDRDKARRWYEKAIAAGDAEAMQILGYMCEADQDFAKARKWYENAVAAGEAGAMINIAQLYEEGRGVPQDYGLAREWYEKSAAAGETLAMTALSRLYSNAQGVPQDYGKAREWKEKAADAGDGFAMADLGDDYLEGRGVPQDFFKAREWYEKAVAAGNQLAMVDLGALYEQGQGVPQDYSKARELYEKAAPYSSEAHSLLAALYLEGRGVPKDDAKGREWLEKAAELGATSAMTQLGEMYATAIGAPQDLAKAREWFEKAALAGDTSALGTFAWFAILAKEPAIALDTSERALKIAPDALWIETNHAHALMYLGRAAEAKALYLAHRGEPIPEIDNKPWEQGIASDFAEFRKAGLEHPQMAEIESALGISSP